MGEERVERVVERQLAAVDQQHHGEGGELLGAARHAEVGLRRAGDVVLDVGQAVGVLEDELAAVVGEDAGAGGVGESLLDAGDEVVGGGSSNLRRPGEHGENGEGNGLRNPSDIRRNDYCLRKCNMPGAAATT